MITQAQPCPGTSCSRSASQVANDKRRLSKRGSACLLIGYIKGGVSRYKAQEPDVDINLYSTLAQNLDDVIRAERVASVTISSYRSPL